jgi:hypothetical protein
VYGEEGSLSRLPGEVLRNVCTLQGKSEVLQLYTKWCGSLRSDCLIRKCGIVELECNCGRYAIEST